MRQTPRQPRRASKYRTVSAIARLVAAVAVIASGAAFLSGAVPVSAAACPTPATDLGTDTITMNVPAAATYVIWTRMKAPDTSHNSINLQVDGNTCFNVGGGSFTATSWGSGSGNWVKYQNGSVSNTITMTLSAGNHTFKYIGTQAGVEIDKVIITSDASCTPTGTGTDCQTGDSTAPTVSLTTPTANQAVSGNVSLKATATDASGIASVQFLVDGNPVNTDTTAPYEYSWNSASVANGQRSISARAIDTNNNTATSPAVTVNVNNSAVCSAAPSVPAGLRVSGITSNSVTLAWNTSVPAPGCTIQGYKVYRNGTLVGSPTSTTYTDTGLTPGSSYNYTVAAADTTNHTSAQSAPVVGTPASDTVAPSAPTNLRSTVKTATSVTLAWNASTDNTGIREYVIFRNSAQVGTSTSTSFTDSALVPSSAYVYTVKARDLAGNESPASAGLSLVTSEGTSANRGDLNGNNKVDIADLSILLSHWNQTGVPITQGDVNGSGKVDIVDLSILLSNWGKTV